MSIKRNTLYNVGGSVLPIAVALVTVPLFLGLIGEARYGVLSIAWVLVGYFGFLDMGLGRATAHRIATLAHANPSERAAVFWTALSINAGLGLLGGVLVLVPAYIFFGQYFDVSAPLRREMLAAVPWLSIAVPVATVGGVLSGALQGRERFLELNGIRILGTLLTQLLPLTVAWIYGPSLVGLIPAAIAGRVVTFGLLFMYCRKHVPLVGRPQGRRTLIAPLFAYGGWVTVTAIVGPLMVTLDRFLIGAFVGAQAVTYYVVPHNLASKVMILPGALSHALFPRFAASTQAGSETMTQQAVAAILAVVTPLIAGGILIMSPFLAWWIDGTFALRAATVGQIIALGLWVNALAQIPFARLQGLGRPDIVAICHLAELLPYLLAVGLALHWWGIEGAAGVWSLRCAVDTALLCWFSRTRVDVVRLIVPAAALAGSMFIALWLDSGELTYWLVAAGLLAIISLWSWLVAPGELKAAFRRVLLGRKRAPEASVDHLGS